jgi:hypothetical protein
MADWLSIRADPIEAVEHGVAQADTFFASRHTGPVTFEKIEYPAAEVLPDETSRADATNWSHGIMVNLYFERDRELDYVDDVLHAVADVIENVHAELETLPTTNNWYPESIQDFAGELDNTALLLVMIRFRITTAVDPGSFT